MNRWVSGVVSEAKSNMVGMDIQIHILYAKNSPAQIVFCKQTNKQKQRYKQK